MNETTEKNELGNTTDNTHDEGRAVRRPRKRDLKNLMKRDGIWYFHRVVKGKREFGGRKTPFSLETTDLQVAKTKRDAILRAASGAEVDRVLGRENTMAVKLSEVFAAYRRSPMVLANQQTRDRNLTDLVRMVRIVKGAECDVEGLSSVVLDWKLIEDWQLRRMTIAQEACGEDRAAFEAAKRGINSVQKSVQSVFSKVARSAYRTLYLPPNIHDFATAPGVPARRQEAPEHLTDTCMLSLFAAAAELRLQDAGAWAAFQLMAWAGLRNTEACHARTTWLQRSVNGYLLTLKPASDFLPKGNSREVIIPAEVAEALLALPRAVIAETGKEDNHLVPATSRSDRMDACYRRLNEWLKEQQVGREVGKIAYRLRKYFLKKVAVQQHPLMAQVAGGHSSMHTTQTHYIGLPKMTEPIRLPVDLAKMLSYRLDEKPASCALELATVLSLQQAAQLLELNAGDLAARSEQAQSVSLEGFVLTVRRDGLNGPLVPAPVALAPG